MNKHNYSVDAGVSHCNTLGTIIYEDDNVMLVQNRFGAYVEYQKRSLEDVLSENPDECTEEAIECLRERNIQLKF